MKKLLNSCLLCFLLVSITGIANAWPIMQLSYTVTANTKCSTPCNGAIDLTVTQGHPPFSYKWNTGATTQDISGLCAGTYSVTVKDLDNVVKTLSIAVTSSAPACNDNNPCTTDACVNNQCKYTPTNLAVTANTTPPSSCQQPCNGSISLAVTGGTSPYSYQWSTGGGTTTTITKQISTGNDDSEEYLNGGSILINGTHIDLGYQSDNAQIIGLRFPGLTIPAGAVITSARLDFVAYESLSSTTNLVIKGEKVDNSAAFTTASYNLSGKAKTTASVNWNNVPSWNSGSTYSSPEIKTILNEIISRPGWASGNALSLFVTGTGSRASHSYENYPSKAAKLKLTYTTSGNSLTGLCAGDYTVTITDASGCSIVKTTTLNCVPVCNLVVNAGNDAPLCSSSTTTLTASSTGASNCSTQVITDCDHTLANSGGWLQNTSYSTVCGDNAGTKLWTKGGEGTSYITLDLGSVLPAGTPICVNMKLEHCSNSSTSYSNAMIQASTSASSGFTNLTSSVTFTSMAYKEYCYSLASSARYIRIIDNGNCAFRVDYVEYTTPGISNNTVTYSWSGPGIVGATNTATVTVNQPGTYIVTATDCKGCVDTDEVRVISCNDNNACTTDNCNQTGCTYTPVNCNDNNACTTDNCNPQTGCTYSPIGCNDNNACTTDNCNPQTGCTNITRSCNDNNACTTDNCNPQTGCTNTTINCNDNNACTTDNCNSQTGCTHNPVSCNDNNACTTDNCNPQTGCTNSPIGCNDNNACTTDNCNPQTGCTNTTINCNDNNACTTDNCNSQTGCTHNPVSCNDNNACTTDNCNPQTGCTNSPVGCNDNNACTSDNCNPQTGCTNSPVSCADNNACTTDNCNAQTGCTHDVVSCNDGNACTTDNCNPQTGCTHDAVSCNDGNACTTDNCNPNTGCTHETVRCNDGNECTNDACDPSLGCVNTPKEIRATITKSNVSCDCIEGANGLCKLDFAGLVHGQILNTQYAAQGIHFKADATSPGVDTMIIFNSNIPGTPDPDLEVYIGNLAIIPMNINGGGDGIVDIPNDNARGGVMTFTFDQEKTVVSFDIVDIDHLDGDPHAIAYDEFNNVLLDVSLPILGDGSVQTVLMNVSGVRKLVINTTNSIGVTNFIFDCICCDGAASVEASGGTAPYTYSWSNGATTSSIDELCPDEYCVTVTDVNGCSRVECTEIEEDCGGDLCVGINCDDFDACTIDNCEEGECGHTPIQDCNSCPLAIEGFTIVRPGTDGDVAPLTDGLVINRDTLCRFNIRAEACAGTVKSVKFELNGDVFRIESAPPFALAGDNPPYNFTIWKPNPGVYVLTATPYSGTAAMGNAGPSVTVTFTVVGGGNCECGDNNACTIDSLINGNCTHTPKNCSDNDACTIDGCADGVCSHRFIQGCGTVDPCANLNCVDDNECTTDDGCSNGICLHSAVNCNDDNACTEDGCNPESGCANSQIEDCGNVDPCAEVNCDDENECTTEDGCEDGICLYSTVDCNDNDACTQDACDPQNGCTTADTDCNDHDACTEDGCDSQSGCTTAGKDCNDNNECTDDSCDPLNGCSNIEKDCNDNDACTEDACDPQNGCTTAERDCSDSDECTDNACDPVSGCVSYQVPGCGGPCANSQLQANASATNPNPCNACNGKVTAAPTGGTPPYTYSWSTGATTQSIGGGTRKGINAGGAQFIASTGDTFLVDQLYNPGAPGTTAYSNNNALLDILGTTDDVMFKTERNAVAPPTGTGTMTYSIPVVNGQYDVSLYFAEIYFGAVGGQLNPPGGPVGKRVFNVSIEGNQVLTNYDIVADVGSATATIKTFTATVTDGFVTILFTNVINRAKVSAIKVKPHTLCSGSYSVIVTDANGCSASGNVELCGGGAKMSEGDLNNSMESFTSEISELNVYPNPFEDKLKVSFESAMEGTAEIRMVGMLGQIVTSVKTECTKGENQTIISLDHQLASGVYFMEFRIGEQVQYVKLMKSK